MKRNMSDTRSFGFCLQNESCLYVSQSDFDYFMNCDASIILCCNVDCQCYDENHIHKLLPSIFEMIQWKTFLKFVRNKTIKNLDIDCKLWKSLLDYLGAKEKYMSRLKAIVSVFDCSSSTILSAWQTFQMICQDKTKIDGIPKTRKNIEFFHAHNCDVFIEEPFCFDKDHFIPNEIFTLLNENHTILSTSTMNPNYKFWIHDFVTIYFFENELEDNSIKNERVKNICDVLLKNQYVILWKDDNIQCIAPANSKLLNINFERSHGNYENCFKILLTPLRAGILSVNKMVISSRAIEFWENNDFTKIDPTLIIDLPLFILTGIFQSNKTEEEFNESELKYYYGNAPRLNPNLSNLANICQLRLLGFEPIYQFHLF